MFIKLRDYSVDELRLACGAKKHDLLVYCPGAPTLRVRIRTIPSTGPAMCAYMIHR